MKCININLAVLTALIFGLAACGGGGGGGDTVTPPPMNLAPIANAGADQNVSTLSKVVLDGTHSFDEDGDLINYTWSILSVPPGSNITSLAYPDSAKPLFRPDADGVYQLSLAVTDGQQNSAASDSVVITASSGNSAPVANAGRDQSVKTNTLVTLDGNKSSDTNNTTLTYAWSFQAVPTDAAPPILNGASTANPTFTPLVNGDYVLLLTVSDGSLSSMADSVRVTATTGNSAPMANAGITRHVAVGSQLTLNGANSTDADTNDILNYQWQLVSRPTGSNVTGASNSNVASPNFTTDLPGVFVFGLMVNDGRLASNMDTVSINVYPPISDQLAAVASAITLTPSQTLPINSGSSGGVSYTFQVLGYALCVPDDPYIIPLASSTLPETIYGCTNTVSPPSHNLAVDGSQVTVTVTIPKLYIDLDISTSVTGNDSGYIELTNVVITSVIALTTHEGSVYDYINSVSSNVSHASIAIYTSDSVLNSLGVLALVSNSIAPGLDDIMRQATDDVVQQALIDSRGADIQ